MTKGKTCTGTTMMGFDIVEGQGKAFDNQVRCEMCRSLLPRSYLYSGETEHIIIDGIPKYKEEIPCKKMRLCVFFS